MPSLPSIDELVSSEPFLMIQDGLRDGVKNGTNDGSLLGIKLGSEDVSSDGLVP